ncbi:hypothetical protein Tco_0606826 [Tanacetum coccineum]
MAPFPLHTREETPIALEQDSNHDTLLGGFKKDLDEGFSSKKLCWKFSLRLLTSKLKRKVTGIEESKDLSSLAIDELIGNLKVHEVVMEKDSEIYKGKKERVKSIALKAKKESSVMKLRHTEAMTKNILWPEEVISEKGCLGNAKRRVIGNALDAVIPVSFLLGDCSKPSAKQISKGDCCEVVGKRLAK